MDVRTAVTRLDPQLFVAKHRSETKDLNTKPGTQVVEPPVPARSPCLQPVCCPPWPPRPPLVLIGRDFFFHALHILMFGSHLSPSSSSHRDYLRVTQPPFCSNLPPYL